MPPSLERARQQYLEQQVASASPERLVTLLYDRLLVDIDRARAAQETADWIAASGHLTHAQQIVAELSSSLTDVWDGADGLRSIYTYLLGRLISANVERDRAAADESRDLVAPLREAWHLAAQAGGALPASVTSALV